MIAPQNCSDAHCAGAEARAIRDDALSLADVLSARSYLYLLFHKVFGGVPTKELLEVLASQATAEVIDAYADESKTMERFGRFLAQLADRLGDDGFLWKTEAEYTRFFIGPNNLPAPPWASPYLTSESAAFSEESLNVRRAYAKHHMKPKKIQHVPDDHVALMCDFMAEVAERSLAALRSGELDQAEMLIEDQCAFVRDHMVAWLPQFATLACKGEGACLIPQAAKAVAAFAVLDETFLGEALVWLRENRDSGDAVESALACDRPPHGDEKRSSLRALRLKFLEDNELCEL